MTIARHEALNFVLSNRIPRRLATRMVGRLSKIEQPLVRDLSIGIWRLFADLDLSDAEETRFRSLHHCFTRTLKPGARVIDTDPAVLVSPCDAIVGAIGSVADGRALQIKGSPYAIADLLADPDLARGFNNGRYVTLRLLSSMYHRFHAPHDCCVTAVTHVPGDAWNVNPPALKRVPALYCRNERAVLTATLSQSGCPVALVAVAAILVAGIRLRFLSLEGRPNARSGWQTIACRATFSKGEEMGWFEHGSTIVLLVPDSIRLDDGLREGARIQVGQKLGWLPA